MSPNLFFYYFDDQKEFDSKPKGFLWNEIYISKKKIFFSYEEAIRSGFDYEGINILIECDKYCVDGDFFFVMVNKWIVQKENNQVKNITEIFNILT